MKWPTLPLSELFRVKHGFAFKSRYFESEGRYVLLTPGSFYEEGGFREQGEKQKFYTGDVPAGFVLDEGDLLVAMTEQAPGLLGSSAWIPAGDRYLHNQRLGRIVDVNEHRADKRFLYHLFNTRDVRQQISGSASGTKVRHTSPERIGRVRVRLPTLESQRRIAEMLSAYDDLIGNNRRRMVLIEETSRQLYLEWFIRLRFPGHENTRIADGVPEGWERKPIGDVITLNYGKALKEEKRVEGGVLVFGSSGVIGRHNQALVDGPGIIVGRKGNVGRVFWSNTAFWPIDTVYFIASLESSLFLYHCLKTVPFQSGDVAVPGLNRDYAHSIKILVAAHAICKQFEEMVSPLFAQLAMLGSYNEKLRAARDLVMPRLMSGETAV